MEKRILCKLNIHAEIKEIWKFDNGKEMNLTNKRKWIIEEIYWNVNHKGIKETMVVLMKCCETYQIMKIKTNNENGFIVMARNRELGTIKIEQKCILMAVNSNDIIGENIKQKVGR